MKIGRKLARCAVCLKSTRYCASRGCKPPAAPVTPFLARTTPLLMTVEELKPFATEYLRRIRAVQPAPRAKVMRPCPTCKAMFSARDLKVHMPHCPQKTRAEKLEDLRNGSQMMSAKSTRNAKGGAQ